MQDKLNNSALRPEDVIRPLPAKRPKGRPVTHGLYSKFTLAPLTDEKYRQIEGILKGQRLLIAPSDVLLVNMLARLLAQIELMGRWLSEHGIFQDDADGSIRGTVSPLVAEMRHSIKVASQLCGQLGLSPESRVKLGKGVAQTEDLASRIQRLKQE